MKDQDQHPEIVALAMAQGITLDPCLLRDYPVGTWFWAVHHQVICEPLTEPLINRIRYILTDKDATERPTRLRALRPVKSPDDLPPALLKAWAKREQARATYEQALAGCDQAWGVYCQERDKYCQALATYEQALDMYCQERDKYEQALDMYCQERDKYCQARDKREQALATYEQALATYDQAWGVYCQERDKYCQERATYEQARPKRYQQLLAQWDGEYPDHPKWRQDGLVF